MADQKPGAGSRPALTTSDLDEAAAVIGDLYLPVVIEADAGQTLEVRLEALRLHSMTAGLLTCSQDAQIVTAVPDHFHVNLPLNGRVASRAGLDSPVVSTPQQAMVFMPGKPASISWTEGTTQLCLMITRTSIESAMQQLLGQQLTQSVQFSPVIDLMSGGGATVRAAMNVVLCDLENGIPADLHPRVGRHIEGLLVDHLLLGQPHNFSDQLLRPTAVSPSLAIDRAIQLLEASPEEAWSTVSLAGAVHLSVRALQRGFERKTGVPPCGTSSAYACEGFTTSSGDPPRRRPPSRRSRPAGDSSTWDDSPSPTERSTANRLPSPFAGNRLPRPETARCEAV